MKVILNVASKNQFTGFLGAVRRRRRAPGMLFELGWFTRSTRISGLREPNVLRAAMTLNQLKVP
jgi:hypothetical protein